MACDPIETVARWTHSTIRFLCGESALRCCTRSMHYVTNEKNPILQILYLIIVNAAYITWLIFGQPLLPTFLVGNSPKYLAALGVFSCFATFYLACKTPPGRITTENVECFMHNHYDGLIYAPNAFCKTCKVVKVFGYVVVLSGN
jgi:palmitoyltransferase